MIRRLLYLPREALVWVLDRLGRLPFAANARLDAVLAEERYCLWCGSPDHDGADCPTNERTDWANDWKRP
jgi:hypothetical protein